MNYKLRINHVARLLNVTPHYVRMLGWEGRLLEVGYDRTGRFYTTSYIRLLRATGIGSKPRRLNTPDKVLG